MKGGDPGEAPATSPPQSPGWIAPLLFVLAVILRSIVALRTSAIFDDGPTFIELARQIQSGDWTSALSHAYHPLYPIAIALVEPVAGSWQAAGLVCSVIGGGIAVVALFFFLREAFDPRTAWVGALLYTISPYVVRFTADVQSEGVFLGFYVSGVACLWRAFDRARFPAAAAAGVLAGLAYLARPEGSGIVAVAAALALWRVLERSWSWSRALRWLSLVLLGFAVVAAPYIQAIQAQGGGWMLSGKKSVVRLIGLPELGELRGPGPDWFPGLDGWGIALALVVLLLFAAWRASRRPGRSEQAPGLKKSRVSQRRDRREDACIAMGEVLPRPAKSRLRPDFVLAAVLALALLRWPAAMGEVFHTTASSLRPEILALAIGGALLLRGREPRARVAFIGVFLVLQGVLMSGLVINYGYLSRRHAMTVIPLLMGPAAIGLQGLADLVAGVWKRAAGESTGRTRTLALALVLIAIAAVSLPKTSRDHRRDALAERQAAQWLGDHPQEPGRLASGKRRSAFYSGRSWIPLIVSGQRRSLASLYGEEVRLIIVDDRLIGSLDGLDEEPGYFLQEIHRVETGGRLARVYALSKAEPR